MIPAWLPVAVPWAGAALLAALPPRRPAFVGPAVAFASFAAAVALAVRNGAERPAADILRVGHRGESGAEVGVADPHRVVEVAAHPVENVSDTGHR